LYLPLLSGKPKERQDNDQVSNACLLLSTSAYATDRSIDRVLDTCPDTVRHNVPGSKFTAFYDYNKKEYVLSFTYDPSFTEEKRKQEKFHWNWCSEFETKVTKEEDKHFDQTVKNVELDLVGMYAIECYENVLSRTDINKSAANTICSCVGRQMFLMRESTHTVRIGPVSSDAVKFCTNEYQTLQSFSKSQQQGQ
jgi:hypothetical protein